MKREIETELSPSGWQTFKIQQVTIKKDGEWSRIKFLDYNEAREYYDKLTPEEVEIKYLTQETVWVK